MLAEDTKQKSPIAWLSFVTPGTGGPSRQPQLRRFAARHSQSNNVGAHHLARPLRAGVAALLVGSLGTGLPTPKPAALGSSRRRYRNHGTRAQTPPWPAYGSPRCSPSSQSFCRPSLAAAEKTGKETSNNPTAFDTVAGNTPSQVTGLTTTRRRTRHDNPAVTACARQLGVS